MKVKATLSAKKLLSDLKEVHGNDLLFHQSGGCCDGGFEPSKLLTVYTLSKRAD